MAVIEVVGVGAGGHAKVVIELLRAHGGFEIVGVLDHRRELAGTHVLGVPVLGGDDLLHDLHARSVRHAFVGVGSTGDPSTRRRLFDRLALQFELVSAVHPRALVSPSAQVGRGPTIMAGAIVNADARLGDNVIVNTGAIVEHDSVLEHDVHVATGARLAGGVHVGEGAHVGAGATVLQGIRIGRGAIVGAGAAVVADVPEGAVVVGVPARVLKAAGAARCKER